MNENTMQLLLSCPCKPGFNYKTPTTFNAHKLNKKHLAWESTQDQKNQRVLTKQLENEVERLKNKLLQREKVENELLNRISDLEKQIDYHRRLLTKKF